jgi:hypothetical protein
MRKLFYNFLLIFILFIFIFSVNAQECQQMDYGDLTVTWTPSPDTRAIGHIIYYYHIEKDMEYNSGPIVLGTNSYNLEKGKLWPGSTYIFKATAYSENQESIRSEPLEICIKDLPPFTPPGKLEPTNWIELVPPGILKQIFE